MNETQPCRPSLLRRMFRSWYVKGALIAVVALALVYAIAPDRVTNIVTVDRSDIWGEDEPLLKQTIVWQRAEPFKDPATGLGADDSLIRPQFAEKGNVFYFTRRTADGTTDIYRSQRVQGEWQPPRPVKQLNSKAHDIGPVLRADGKRLYLSSNREGGQGGFDLYVSDLTEKTWSKPKNLGPTINSAANEYDPAVSGEGTRLFFASNRSEDMMRLLAEGGDGEKHWRATVRADEGSGTYDLYMAQRETSGMPWQAAEPLSEINHPLAKEASPCVGPRGAFLYFISNRVASAKEKPNFDIYRAKIRGDRVFDMENLGAGVNSPLYNEVEPALSEEGFQLYFSSNRPPDGEPGQEPTLQYTLYRSRASEIFEESEWGRSKLGELIAFLVRNWWWVMTSLLTLALLLALVWYFREVSLKRLPLPGIFLFVLMVHIMAGLSSFYIYFGDDIVREIAELKDLILAEEAPLDDLHEHEQDPYEKVAELESLDAVEMSDVAQQPLMPNMPHPVETPIPQIPLEYQRELPPDRLVVADPDIEREPIPDLEWERPQIDLVPEDQKVEMEKPRKIELAMREPIHPEPVDQKRRNIDTQLRELRLPRQMPSRAMKITNEKIDAEKITERQPEVPIEAPPMEPKAASSPEVADAPLVPIRPVHKVAPSPAADPVARPQVTVPRQQPAGEVSPKPPSAPSARRGMETAMVPTPERPVLEDGGEKVLETRTNQKLTKMGRPTPKVIDSEDAIRNRPLTAPIEGKRAAGAAKGIDVRSPRRRSAASVPGAPKVLHPTATRGAVPLERENARAQQDIQQPAATRMGQPTDLKRTAPAEAQPAQFTKLGTLPLLKQGGQPRPEQAAEGVAVNVPRRQPIGLAAGPPNLAPRTAASTSTQVTREEGKVERIADQARSISRPAAAGAAPAKRTTTPLVQEGEVSIEKISIRGPRSSATSTPVHGIAVNLEKSDALAMNVPFRTPGKFGGRHDPQNPKLNVDSLERERADADLRFNPRASRIVRRPAKAPLLDYAEDNIGLEDMFRSRQGVPKAELIQAFTGKPKEEADKTLEAVARGLVWLGEHQHPDGYWNFKKFYGKDGKKMSRGGVDNNAGATGFALLPFLGNGKTHIEGPYQSNVGKALEWLMKEQSKEGDFCPKGGGNTHMYSHAIATIAMCEAYGMTKDPKLRDPAQRAIDFIVAAQDTKKGGWRYQPKQRDSDTSVVGWQMMALKSGQMAGLDVPQKPFPLVDRWLRSVEGKGKENMGRFAYQGGKCTPAMTAEGLLCLQYLGTDQNDPRLLAGADYLMEHLPGEKKKGESTSYYWYYGTQVMFHLQGERWKRWNDALQDMLLRTQKIKGPETGTWDPSDRWEKQAGRLYSTSLRLLMLEVYYRHLPLYQMRAEKQQ